MNVRTSCWVVVLLGALVLPAAWSKEAGGGKEPRKGAEGDHKSIPLPTTEGLDKQLGADQALTEDQKTKINAAREELKKKFDALMAKPEAAAAQEELKKAREAVGAAEKKLTDALGGFNARDEFKKATDGILTDAQKAKLYPAKPEPRKKEK